MRRYLLIVAVLFLLAPSAAADISIANDPAYIAVGARTLGMGKAYVGVADDLLGIFNNPAALAYLSRWQATSLTAKLLSEYSYFNGAVAVPLRQGSVGVGVVTSGIDFLAPTATLESRDGVRYVPTGSGSSYSYGNNLLLLSYGTSLAGLTRWRWLDRVSVGATWKMYFASMSGPGITGGAASGNELDLGLHYEPNKVLKAGLVLQNALPLAMGGKIKWDSGAEESLPALLKTGISFKVFGKEGWRRNEEQELACNLDVQSYPTNRRLPTLLHLGLEWSVSEFLDLRTGLDQDYVGRDSSAGLSTGTNLTFGVGLFYRDLRFDYAYHKAQPEANDTHYFALSYGFDRAKEVEKEPFTGILPADKTRLYAQGVAVTGRINDSLIKNVVINGYKAAIDAGQFQTDLPLKPGKNSITVAGYDAAFRLVGKEKLRYLNLKKFTDVEPDHWAAGPISLLSMQGVISGYPDGSFKPEGRITRAEFTKLLLMVNGIGDYRAQNKPYKDVPMDHWAVDYVSFAARGHYIKGYPGWIFKPSAPVTRAEGVSMISRFAGLAEPRMADQPFSDLPGRHWASRDVHKAFEAGILKYLAGRPFEARRYLTRAEVAEMLSKTPPLAARVAEMLDWRTGY